MAIDLIHPDKNELLRKWGHLVQATNHIHTWTSTLELCWLCEYVQGKSHYIEIGSHSGRSAKCVLLANPNLRLLSLDTWDDAGSWDTYAQNLRQELLSGRAQFYKGESQKNLIGLPAPPFDACFIDGGHLAPLVEADIRGTRPLMKPGSLMAGHDYRVTNDVAGGVRAVFGAEFHNPVDSIWAYQL